MLHRSLCRLQLASTMSTRTVVSSRLFLPLRFQRAHSKLCAQTAQFSIIDAEGIFPSDAPNDEMKLDAIIVLGGGLTAGGDLPLWVKRRLDLAHSLYVSQVHAPPILCSGGGTPHKPPVLDQEGFVVHEATRCSDYLQTEKQVPATRLFKELGTPIFASPSMQYLHSGSALQVAMYISMWKRMLYVKYIVVAQNPYDQPIHPGFVSAFAYDRDLSDETPSVRVLAKWAASTVVTSSFHMPRSRALFEHMWQKAHATQGLLLHDRSELYFAEASDEGVFESDVLEARTNKEKEALHRWLQDSEHLPDLKHLHWWLHQTHRCYAVARQHEGSSRASQPRNDLLLASY